MRLFIRGSAVLAVLVGLLMVVLPTLAATRWAGIDWDGEYVEPTTSLTVEADGSLHVVTTGPDDDAHLWDAFSAPRSETWVGGYIQAKHGCWERISPAGRSPRR